MKPWTVDPRKQAVADLSESLAGDAPQSGWAKWFGGMLVPLVVAAIGFEYCLRREAVLSGSSSIDLHGRAAVAMGLAWITAGAFLHFHYFWGNLDRLRIFSNFGKTLSALGFIGAFGYVLWSIIMR